MKRALLMLALAAACAQAARAQAQASLGVGVGTVRFPGGTSFSSATFAPTLEYATEARYGSLAGSFASLPGGIWSLQGRADVWAATRPLRGRMRLGAEGIGAGTRRTDGGWTAAVHGIGEFLWWTGTWGVGVGAGPSSGWIKDAPSVGAFHARARAWWRAAPGTTWQLSVEPTHFLGAWFTDVSSGVTIERGPVSTTLWAVVRASDAYGSKGTGSVSLRWFVAPAVSLEASGGGYLPDPYQGLDRAGYFTASVRMWARRRPAVDAPTRRWPPLVPERRGDSVVVRFSFEGAKAVAIAGDWNAWQPVPLRPLAGDEWEGAFLLESGLYHFNLLVDGWDWVVPNGVATVRDGLGGLVAVLLVP